MSTLSKKHPLKTARYSCALLLSSFLLLSACQAQTNEESHSHERENSHEHEESHEQENSQNNQQEFNIGQRFFELLVNDDPIQVNLHLKYIENNWNKNLVPMTIETLNYAQSSKVRNKLDELIKSVAPSSAHSDSNQLFQWAWNQDLTAPQGYADFKAELYSNIDHPFYGYFHDRQDLARIRLDEIRWGGVIQDGIPPLRNPEMISVQEADYLEDDNVVFGIEINGDVRAYPKRILAWHEMFTDTIGGVEIAGVYCTLCGTVIPYKTNHKGKQYTLGTSGFLYRSNKLMYDKDTQSLWSTTKGTPVVGPLVDKGIELEYESVVTTTWGEWKRRHPNTTVLSLNTGHRRDYGEGVAYNNYFSTDRLMFNTPFNDDRLANKREVLALRFPAAPNQQLAIDTDFLSKKPVYKNNIGAQSFIVLTDKTGANRVYDPKDVDFTSYDGDQTVTDANGNKWTLSESDLKSDNGQRLARLPYHRAFWFGWRAAYPETKLIK